MRRLAILSFVLFAAASGGAASAPVSAPRLASRDGIFDDPGVVAIRYEGGPAIERVFFGRNESPLIAPWYQNIPGPSVAVPPGVAGTRVPVRVKFADGTSRKLGAFRYHERIELTGRTHWVGSGRECPSGDVGTFSGVRRLPRGRFRYTYRAENGMPGPVTIRWPALAHLGLPGGLTATIPGGQNYTITRIAGGTPVEVAGPATSDVMPGCAPAEAGESWYGPALFPASELPVVVPPGDVDVTVDEEFHATVTWTYPGGADVPEKFEVTWRSVGQNYSQCVEGSSCGPPVLRYSNTLATEDGTARTLSLYLPLPGVNSIAVRAVRGGVASRCALASVVR